MRAENLPLCNVSSIGITLSIVLLLVATTVAADVPDSTRVRRPKKQSRSLGSIVFRTPQYILTSPEKVVEFTTRLTIEKIVEGQFGKPLINLLSGVERVRSFAPVAGYGSNSGLKGGVSFTIKDEELKRKSLKMKGSYSTNNYQHYYIRLRPPPLQQANTDILVAAEYRKRPRESFYGLGPRSIEETETAFTYEWSQIGAKALWEARSGLIVGLAAAYRAMNTFDGDDPDEEGNLDSMRARFGLTRLDMRSSRLWQVGLSLRHDWRDHKGQPSSGGLESISITYHKGVGRSDDLEYLISRIDLRHYVNIYKKRLLEFRVLLQTLDVPTGHPSPPFYLRSSLGGKANLKGYRTRRFVDSDFALASVQYRWPIWKVVDAFIFLEEGRVFADLFDGFSSNDWSYSTGGGIRIWKKEGILLHTSAAFSREGTRFYIELSEKL